MSRDEIQQLVITTAIAASVSAVASAAVSYLMQRMMTRWEQAQMEARDQELSLREYAVAQAYERLAAEEQGLLP